MSIQPLTKKIIGGLGKKLGLTGADSNIFGRMARESDIGGKGTEFKNMGLDDQNAFITSYNNRSTSQTAPAATSEKVSREKRAARAARGKPPTSPPIVNQAAGARPANGTRNPTSVNRNPSQIDPTAAVVHPPRGADAVTPTTKSGGMGVEPPKIKLTPPSPAATPSPTTPKLSPWESAQNTAEAAGANPFRGLPEIGPGGGVLPARAPAAAAAPEPNPALGLPEIGPGGGVLPPAKAPAPLKTPTPPPSTTPTPPPAAPSASPPLTHQAAELEPSDTSFWRILAGDTSGKAAANAGAEFMAGAERVFTGDAGRAVSGLGGDDASNILKQAWGAADDDAFKDVLAKGGVSDDAVTNLSAFRSEIQKVDNEGGQLSEAGMSAMMKNQGELGSMYGGFNRAGASASPNALLRAIGGESGHGFGNAMGIAAVAGLAGGANVAMGGDFTEGAAVGGGVAFGARAIAKGVAGSMGDIESAMVKNILGDDAVTAGSREVKDEIIERVSKGTKLTELPAVAQRELTMEDINPKLGTPREGTGEIPTIAKTSVEDFISQAGGTTKMKTKRDAEYIYEGTRTEQVTGAQARKQNLTSIAAMKGDDPRLKGFGKKKMQKLLDPDKEKNVAMNNRLLTLGGGMLAGVAFTGQSDKRNYRRGFNAHRGNRI